MASTRRVTSATASTTRTAAPSNGGPFAVSHAERGRLLNLVRYVLASFPDGIEFAKLSNLLYLADREAYLNRGETITHARHIKRSWGVEVVGLRRVASYLRQRGEVAA
ncbi:MAG TPA: hypothetical protein VMH41_16840 [Mycobacteriales bacterium]|nr:hypothetical protein [Mycobacteriales bacterium]